MTLIFFQKTHFNHYFKQIIIKQRLKRQPLISYINSNIEGYETTISSKSSVNRLKEFDAKSPPTSCGVVNGDNLDVIPPKSTNIFN